jgi:hypothetical protein
MAVPAAAEQKDSDNLYTIEQLFPGSGFRRVDIDGDGSCSIGAIANAITVSVAALRKFLAEMVIPEQIVKIVHASYHEDTLAWALGDNWWKNHGEEGDPVLKTLQRNRGTNTQELTFLQLMEECSSKRLVELFRAAHDPTMIRMMFLRILVANTVQSFDGFPIVWFDTEAIASLLAETLSLAIIVLTHQRDDGRFRIESIDGPWAALSLVVLVHEGGHFDAIGKRLPDAVSRESDVNLLLTDVPTQVLAKWSYLHDAAPADTTPRLDWLTAVATRRATIAQITSGFAGV